jgi:hypothetical protein
MEAMMEDKNFYRILLSLGLLFALFSFLYNSYAQETPSLTLLLDGEEVNKAYFLNDVINVTAMLDIPNKLIFIKSDIPQINNLSGESYISTIFVANDTGEFFVRAVFEGDENYSAVEKTLIILISEAPEMEVTETIDEEAPTYSQATVNSTFAGKPTQFMVKITDNFGLSGYIFSFDNGNGIFVNDSFVELSGKSDWIIVAKTIHPEAGKTIRWRIYGKDINENWSNSETFSFTTTPFPVSRPEPTPEEIKPVKPIGVGKITPETLEMKGIRRRDVYYYVDVAILLLMFFIPFFALVLIFKR